MKRTFVMIIVMILFVITTGCAGEDWLFSAENNEIRIPIPFVFEMDGDVVDEETKEYFENIDKVATSEIDIEKVELELFEETKKDIIDFMEEVYDLDVSDKINQIETYLYTKADNPNDTRERGYYEPGTTHIKLNRALLENWEEDDVRFIFAHESFHYLGLIHNRSVDWFLYEAATAAITDTFINWAEYDVYQSDDYWEIKDFILQMERANPNLIANVFREPQYRIEDSINEVLKNAEYPYFTPGMDEATLFGGLMQFCITYADPYIFFTAQEMTLAYCREFDLDKSDIKYIREKLCDSSFDTYDFVYDPYAGYYLPVF